MSVCTKILNAEWISATWLRSHVLALSFAAAEFQTRKTSLQPLNHIYFENSFLDSSKTSKPEILQVRQVALCRLATNSRYSGKKLKLNQRGEYTLICPCIY